MSENELLLCPLFALACVYVPVAFTLRSKIIHPIQPTRSGVWEEV